jgi:predicted ATPase
LKPQAVTPVQFSTFGELLKFLRRRAGLTQLELSIAVGYSNTQISRMEQNQRVPDQATLAARFVPPLQLEDQPDWLNRLLELAALARQTADVPTWAAPAAEVPQAQNLARIVRGRMVGRERELEELLAAWQGAVQQICDERVLLVSGEAGVGKSRLVRELMTQARAAKAVALLGECYAEQSPPYAPLAQVVRQAVLETGGLGRSVPADRVLADAITLAPDLRERFPELRPNPKLDSEDEQIRLYDSMVELMVWLSARAPILLVIEDAHWADPATLGLLRHLARRSKTMKLPLVLAATYREVELDQGPVWHEVLGELNRERLSTGLKLERLDKARTSDMLAVLFNEAVTPEFVDVVYSETEGNPFFIEEVVKALIDEGKIYYAEGRWRRPPMKEIVVPQSVRLAIQARLAALQADVQEMLQMAAVLGRDFDDCLIRQALDYDEDKLMAALEGAEKAQLIRETKLAQPGGVAYTFVHALIHATIYEGVSGLRRQRLHRRAAAAAEVARPQDYEVLAAHYQEGGDLERARQNALKAGDRALGLYANPDAEKYYRLALDLSSSGADKAQALYGLAQAVFGQGRLQESIDIWKQAVPLYRELRDYDRLARTYASLTEMMRRNDDIEGGIAWGEEGLALLADQPTTPGKVGLMREIGQAFTARGAHDKAVVLCRRALEEAEKIGDKQEQADSLIHLGFEIFDQGGDRLEGRRMLERALELAEASGWPKTASAAEWYLQQFYEESGDVQTALRHNERALQLSRQMGWAAGELRNLDWKCYVALTRGDVADYEAGMERGRYLAALIGHVGGPCLHFRFTEAIGWYAKGEVERAMSGAWEVFQASRQAHNINWAVYLGLRWAAFLILEARWADAEAISSAIIQIMEQENAKGPYYMLAISCGHQGKFDAAHAALEQAQAIAGKPFVYSDRFYSALACAHLAWCERRWDDAWRQFDAAYEQMAQMGYRWYQALLKRQRAEALLERGEPGDQEAALDLLEGARALYQSMPLPARVESVEERLREVRENHSQR